MDEARIQLLEQKMQEMQAELDAERAVSSLVFKPGHGQIFHTLNFSKSTSNNCTPDSQKARISVGNCFEDSEDVVNLLGRIECSCTRPKIEDGEDYYTINITALAEIDFEDYDWKSDDEGVIESDSISDGYRGDMAIYATGLYGKTEEQAIARARKYGPFFLDLVSELNS